MTRLYHAVSVIEVSLSPAQQPLLQSEFDHYMPHGNVMPNWWHESAAMGSY